MRILLIGGNGQLGFELHRQLSVFGDVSITTRTSKCPAGYPCIHLDLSDGEAIRDLLESLRPHLVVNAGAYTQVDRAESEREAADSANKIAVQTIAKKCREIGSLLVHFSSDYVYSGENRVPWVETDPTQPFSYYGLSKLGGDQAIVDSGCPYWIIRTQWLYSARGANFLRTMLRVAHERFETRNDAPIQVVNDQFGAPTPVRWVASAVVAMLSRWLTEQAEGQKAKSGIYHLSAAGKSSWFDFAAEIFSQAHMLGLLEQMPELQAVSTATFAAKAPRPRYTVLNTQKIQREFDIELPDWRVGVEQVLAEYKLALTLR
jgi:dTDP-4-dehydrorhamnose reductase